MSLQGDAVRTGTGPPPGPIRTSVLIAGLGVLGCLAVAALVGKGQMWLALAIALVPMLAWAAWRHPAPLLPVVVCVCLTLPLFGIGVGQAVELPIGRLYPSDVLALLAAGLGVIGLLRRREPRVEPATIWLILCLAFGVALMPGITRGAAEHDQPLVGNTMRIFAYAGVGLLVACVRLADLERALRLAFSAGIPFIALLGTVYLLTGVHQTGSSHLSTGGERTLALSVVMYAGFGMLFALLQIVARPNRKLPALDWLVLAAGVYVQGLALGRATIGALVVLMAVIVLAARRARLATVTSALIAVPIAVGVIAVVQPAPAGRLQTAVDRVREANADDPAIAFRLRATEAMLEELDGHLLLGAGFGVEPVIVFLGEREVIRGGDPHNSFVWILVGGGLVAFAGLVAVIGYSIARGVARFLRSGGADRVVIAWSLASLVLFLANILTEPFLGRPWLALTFWLLLSVPVLGIASGSRRAE